MAKLRGNKNIKGRKNRIFHEKLNHFLYNRIIAKSGGDVILNLKDTSKKLISTASDLLKDEKNREKAKSIFSTALKQAKKLKKNKERYKKSMILL